MGLIIETGPLQDADLPLNETRACDARVTDEQRQTEAGLREEIIPYHFAEGVMARSSVLLQALQRLLFLNL